jgi:hypothetical protein
MQRLYILFHFLCLIMCDFLIVYRHHELIFFYISSAHFMI